MDIQNILGFSMNIFGFWISMDIQNILGFSMDIQKYFWISCTYPKISLDFPWISKNGFGFSVDIQYYFGFPMDIQNIMVSPWKIVILAISCKSILP